MGAEYFWRLKEVCQCLENRIDQILLLNVNRVEDKRDQIWVLFQHFDTMSALCEIIDSEDSETFERRVVRLQILLYDRV